METTRQNFRLHLPGLLKVLAEHLYSNRQVAVRELLQNAHDSCTRRALSGADPAYAPRVALAADPVRRTLTVTDNGDGLTESEIVDYLATIGRSFTRETREQLALMAPDDAARLLGQFGFGFLSAYLLASEVEVVSRSASGAPPVRWVSAGDESYTLGPGERDDVGTTIRLTVKPEASFLLQGAALSDCVSRFASLLPLPIHVGDDPVPVNPGHAPWDADDPDAAVRAFLQTHFDVREPLAILPLGDALVATDGAEPVPIPLRGFLFIPPASVASVREYGDLRVYLRGMFLRDGEKHLLPPWARFVRGVVDCPALQPTASREDLHRDATFERVQAAIEEQLGSGLQRIAREEPHTWRRIVEGHADIVTGWAVRDDAFFDRVADLVPVRTSRGRLSLPEYLAQSDGTLYYVERELGSLQERLLAESRGVPVIDASWFAVTPFLHKWAARRRGVGLSRLDDGVEALFRDPGRIPGAESLLDFYDRLGVDARLSTFAPSEAPALLVHPPDAELRRDGAEAAQDASLGPLAGLIGEFVDGLGVGTGPVLHLNASCPLVRRLADIGPGPGRDAALTLVWQLARLFSGRMLSAGDAAQAFDGVQRSLGRLLESGGGDA